VQAGAAGKIDKEKLYKQQQDAGIKGNKAQGHEDDTIFSHADTESEDAKVGKGGMGHMMISRVMRRKKNLNQYKSRQNQKSNKAKKVAS